MRPGVLGGIGWLLLVAALYASSFGMFSPRGFRDAWRGPDALNGKLDESLACDLVTDFVLQSEGRRKVKCGELLEVTGSAARLSEVKVDWEWRTYCLARTPRWTVLRHSRGVPCFPSPPPDQSRALESERERVIAVARGELADRLDGIRRAMGSEVRPARCAQVRKTHHEDVPLLEYELLLGGGGDLHWAFLSTPWLRDAVVKDGPAEVLAAAERWSTLRPWVAVITSTTREQAMAGLGKGLLGPGRVRGRLTGTMTLVDAAIGELLCEAPFSFESSATLAAPPRPGSRKGPDLSALLDFPSQERVNADFEGRYNTAVMLKLGEMTSNGAWPTLR